jgi:hypothetical protein
LFEMREWVHESVRSTTNCEVVSSHKHIGWIVR